MEEIHLSEDEYFPCQSSDVANLTQAIAVIIIVILTLMIIVFLIYRMVILKRNRAPKSVLLYVYGLMLLWGFIFATEYMIQLISFHRISEIEQYDDYPHWFLNIVPRFIQSFEMQAALIIHTLLLIVPYFWIKNILYFLEHAESIDAVGKRTKRFNKCTRIYIIVSRIIFLLATLSIFALPTSLLDEYNTVLRLIISGQALFLIAYLIISFYLLTKNFKQFADVSKQQRVKIKVQSGLLTLVCILRSGFNAYSLFGKKSPHKWDDKLHCVQQKFSPYVYFLISGIILMHFLPIGVIIFIYSPEQQTQKYEQVTNENYGSLISSTV